MEANVSRADARSAKVQVSHHDAGGWLDNDDIIRRRPRSEAVRARTARQVLPWVRGPNASGPATASSAVSGYGNDEGAQLCRTSRGARCGSDVATSTACSPPKLTPTVAAVSVMSKSSQTSTTAGTNSAAINGPTSVRPYPGRENVSTRKPKS